MDRADPAPIILIRQPVPLKLNVPFWQTRRRELPALCGLYQLLSRAWVTCSFITLYQPCVVNSDQQNAPDDQNNFAFLSAVFRYIEIHAWMIVRFWLQGGICLINLFELRKKIHAY